LKNHGGCVYETPLKLSFPATIERCVCATPTLRGSSTCQRPNTTSIMASSSDPDKDANVSQPKPDNPFIKFRQFADSQISSLLQSIVGLPSAFSKNPNNERWADFDEDMRRRDELQKRQNTLRDSEARRQSEGRGLPSWRDSTDIHADDEEMDDRTARDIPLYSPVSRSLFAHLRCAKDDSSPKNGWQPIDDQFPVKWNTNPANTFTRFAEHFRSFQTTVYHDLQSSPVFRSDYSLLPYMLFSPYSPIRLQAETLFQEPLGQEPLDCFFYVPAFVDLLLTTQNRPMGSIPSGYSQKLPVIDPERGYLYNLWAHGVLQERSTTKYPAVIKFQELLTSDWSSWVKKTIPHVTDPPLDPETELEAYERFLLRAFQSVGADGIESFFTEFQGWLDDTLGSLDPIEMKRQLKELTDFLEQKSENEEEDEEDDRHARAIKVLGSFFTQAAGLRGESSRTSAERKRVVERFSDTKVGKELEEFKRKAAAGAENVVSTSTTTERTENGDGTVETRVEVWKHYADGEEVESTCTTTEHMTGQDGSVESKVEVWKKYADGRTTTTTSTHAEEPPSNDDDDDDWEHSMQVERADEKKPDENKEDNKDQKKKGWFWT
jgi:hypothetical protein